MLDRFSNVFCEHDAVLHLTFSIRVLLCVQFFSMIGRVTCEWVVYELD